MQRGRKNKPGKDCCLNSLKFSK